MANLTKSWSAEITAVCPITRQPFVWRVERMPSGSWGVFESYDAGTTWICNSDDFRSFDHAKAFVDGWLGDQED